MNGQKSLRWQEYTCHQENGTGKSGNHTSPPTLDLYVEVAESGCLGHVPALPGLCFRAGSVRALHDIAGDHIAAYVRWLSGAQLAELNPVTAALVKVVNAGQKQAFRVTERERQDGSPVWISGNPAALFSVDCRVLSDDDVHAHLGFVGRVVREMRAIVTPLSQKERAWKPAPNRRSLDETLIHVGNCVWWYCSRVDDALAEPANKEGEDPIDRIERLLVGASEFLLSVPEAHRAVVRVPTRYLTSDPTEPWTHAKVCRRQAEHVWEHLSGLEAAVRHARAME